MQDVVLLLFLGTVPGVTGASKGPVMQFLKMVLRQVECLPHDPRCACMTATTDAQHGLEDTWDGAHPAHAGVTQAT